MKNSEDAVGRVEASYSHIYAEELPLPGEPQAASLEAGLQLIETYTGLPQHEVRRHIKEIVRIITRSTCTQTQMRNNVWQLLSPTSRPARQGLRRLPVPMPRALALPDTLPLRVPRVPEHSQPPQVRREASRRRLLLRTRPAPARTERRPCREPGRDRHRRRLHRPGLRALPRPGPLQGTLRRG